MNVVLVDQDEGSISPRVIFLISYDGSWITQLRAYIGGPIAARCDKKDKSISTSHV